MLIVCSVALRGGVQLSPGLYLEARAGAQRVDIVC